MRATLKNEKINLKKSTQIRKKQNKEIKSSRAGRRRKRNPRGIDVIPTGPTSAT